MKRDIWEATWDGSTIEDGKTLILVLKLSKDSNRIILTGLSPTFMMRLRAKIDRFLEGGED